MPAVGYLQSWRYFLSAAGQSGKPKTREVLWVGQALFPATGEFLWHPSRRTKPAFALEHERNPTNQNPKNQTMHWAESDRNKRSLYLESAKVRLKQVPSLHLHQHPCRERFAWGSSAGPWVHLPDQLCCPEVAPESSRSRMATRQGRGCFL